jgi:hypothetical protein
VRRFIIISKVQGVIFRLIPYQHFKGQYKKKKQKKGNHNASSKEKKGNWEQNTIEPQAQSWKEAHL